MAKRSKEGAINLTYCNINAVIRKRTAGEKDGDDARLLTLGSLEP